ncbi:MAG: type II secretion system F family protein [Puniceicoccales bacterium]|jgi:type IV pilus assembly protein PilC|nr:type II secretion system F family protein [Puniceicoccales bacterium]
MLFRYITRDKTGKRFYGKIEGDNKENLEKQFLEAGHSILLLKELKPKISDENSRPPKKTLARHFQKKHLSREQKSHLIQQLAILMDSGMELRPSLAILLEQGSRFSCMAGALRHLIQHVESGKDLSEALASMEDEFESYEIAMVRSGESVGKLPKALMRLSELSAKSARIRKTLISASFYPLTVLFVSTVIVLLLTLFVIPRFEEILSEQIGPHGMPIFTAIILRSSHCLLQHWKLITTTVFCSFLLLLSLRKWKFFQLLYDRMLLKIPVLRSIIVEWNIILFSRTFGELLHCGSPLMESLRLAREIVKSATIRQSLQHALNDLAHGMTLSEAMGRHHILPPTAQGLISVGDRSGTIGAMMNRIAENYEYQLNGSIERMTKLLEPMLILFLAGFVGSIVIGLFLPLVVIIEGFSGQ